MEWLMREREDSEPYNRLFDSTLSESELKALAQFHLDRAERLAWDFHVTGQTGGRECRQRSYSRRRLDDLATLLGEEAFEAAIGRIRAEWEQTWAKCEEIQKALGECNRCGSPLEYLDHALYTFTSDAGYEQGVCLACNTRGEGSFCMFLHPKDMDPWTLVAEAMGGA